MRSKKILQIITLLTVLISLGACKKGYLTPAHVVLNNTTSAVKMTVLGPAATTAQYRPDALFINDLPVNLGLTRLGVYGITTDVQYSVPVVNGQTFKFRLNSGITAVIDTSLTVAASGLDAYYLYQDQTNLKRFHLVILHTDAQTAPGKGKVKIRFANILSQLPGDHSVKIAFSRKQDIAINDGKPLAFKQVTPYIEIPYGIYQPLLLDAAQQPVLTQTANLLNFGTNTSWSQIELKPGGIYTFLIARGFDSGSSSVGSDYLIPTILLQEGFVPQEPMGKIKLIHVNPYLDDVNIKIDGLPAASTSLRYGQDLPPVIVTQGQHTVDVFDLSGKKIMEKSVTILNNLQQFAFLVDGKDGVPDMQFYNKEPLKPLYAFGRTASTFFNFSPGSPPVSFITGRTFNNSPIYTLFSGDSLVVNVPYLRIPRLTGGNISPNIGSGPYLTDIVLPNGGPLPNLGVGLNITSNPVDPAAVIQGTIIDYPLFEYPSFAKFSGYIGDNGYFLVMLTGLRYTTVAGKGLHIKVIKYIE